MFSTYACQNKSNEVDLKLVTEIMTIVHDSSSLQKSESFENYLTIGEGDKTIYELTVKNDFEGALDAVEWRTIFFSLKDDLRSERIYYLQNDDDFNTCSFIGGAWIGIEKLYGTRGAFKVKSLTDKTLDIEIIGSIEANLLKTDTIEHVIIISDTLLRFKKQKL